MNSLDILLIICIIILIIRMFFLVRENMHLKQERDYYHEVDEENGRLRKRLGEK